MYCNRKKYSPFQDVKIAEQVPPSLVETLAAPLWVLLTPRTNKCNCGSRQTTIHIYIYR